jgi:hypothetical protein
VYTPVSQYKTWNTAKLFLLPLDSADFLFSDTRERVEFPSIWFLKGHKMSLFGLRETILLLPCETFCLGLNKLKIKGQHLINFALKILPQPPNKEFQSTKSLTFQHLMLLMNGIKKLRCQKNWPMTT